MNRSKDRCISKCYDDGHRISERHYLKPGIAREALKTDYHEWTEGLSPKPPQE
jgi:hypothetical protein